MDPSPLSRLAQIAPPTSADNPWIWFVGVAIVVIGFLGNRVLKDGDDWKAQAKTCATELTKTTDALRANTDVIERQRESQADGFAEIKRGQEEIKAEIKAEIRAGAPARRVRS